MSKEKEELWLQRGGVKEKELWLQTEAEQIRGWIAPDVNETGLLLQICPSCSAPVLFLFSLLGYQPRGQICCWGGQNAIQNTCDLSTAQKNQKEREKKEESKNLNSWNKRSTSSWGLPAPPAAATMLSLSSNNFNWCPYFKGFKTKKPQELSKTSFLNINRAGWWPSPIHLSHNYTKVPLEECSLSLLVSPIFIFVIGSQEQDFKIKNCMFYNNFQISS